MSEDRDAKGPEAEFADGDYGYDSAHEQTEGVNRPAPTAQEQRLSFHVEQRTDDDAGDYGYDMAHDMPPE